VTAVLPARLTAPRLPIRDRRTGDAERLSHLPLRDAGLLANHPPHGRRRETLSIPNSVEKIFDLHKGLLATYQLHNRLHAIV
jgi:hypothetical protein